MAIDAPRFRAGFASDEDMLAFVARSKEYFSGLRDRPQALMTPRDHMPDETPDFLMQSVRDMSGF